MRCRSDTQIIKFHDLNDFYINFNKEMQIQFEKLGFFLVNIANFFKSFHKNAYLEEKKTFGIF